MCRTESNTSTLDEQCSENGSTNINSSNEDGDTHTNDDDDDDDDDDDGHYEFLPHPKEDEPRMIQLPRPPAGGGRDRGRLAAMIVMASVVLVVALAVQLEVLGTGMVATSTSSPPAEELVIHGRKRRFLAALFRKLRPGGRDDGYSQRDRHKKDRRNRKAGEVDLEPENTESGAGRKSEQQQQQQQPHVTTRKERKAAAREQRQAHTAIRKALKEEEKTEKLRAEAVARAKRKLEKKTQKAEKKKWRVGEKLGRVKTRARGLVMATGVTEANGHSRNHDNHGKKQRGHRLRVLGRRVTRALGLAGREEAEATHGASVLERRDWMLDVIRRAVDAHPGNLRYRASAVRHDLDDATLYRYLEYTFWVVEDRGETVTTAIEKTLAWRERYQPHRIKNEDVMEEAFYGKLYVRGHDRQGRPIIYYTPGEERSFDTTKGLLLLFHTLERAAASLPHGQDQFAVVADCSGFGPSKAPHMAMVKTAFLTMQHHYPMRLGYVMIVNASSPIVFVWKLISTVLCARTHEKISFLSPKEAVNKLHKHVDPNVLPSTLPGGRSSFRYSNEVYFAKK